MSVLPDLQGVLNTELLPYLTRSFAGVIFTTTMAALKHIYPRLIGFYLG